jgi:hypothetical protein
MSSFLGRFVKVRFIIAFLFGGFFICGGLFGIVFGTAHYIHEEVVFHKKYGKDWVQEYEKYNGPLSQTNGKIAVGIGSLIAICLIAWWGYRQINPYKSNNRKRTRHKRN